MQPKRKRRLYFVLGLVLGAGIAVGLVLYALKQNLNLYLTPSELQAQSQIQQTVRLGGYVRKGSLEKTLNSLKISFIITDFKNNIKVEYDGILPSLFREGQGVIAQGALNAKGVFIATEILAKHDENYRPPHVGENKS